MNEWIKYSRQKPEEGMEVIAYHHKWVDEDFNPNGTRVGFVNGNDEFTSAYWWDEHDCYETINKTGCEVHPDFYKYHVDNTEPEYWCAIPKFKNQGAIVKVSRQAIKLIIIAIGLTIIEIFTVISEYPISKILALICTGICLAVIGITFGRIAIGALIAIVGVLIIALSSLYIAYTVSYGCLCILIGVYLIILAIAI